MSRIGAPVHLEVDSADAHAGVKFTIYDSATLTTRTLSATEYVAITDIIFVSTAGGTYNIVAAAVDTAGARIAKGNAAALGGLAHHFESPYVCPIGITPYLIAAVGQVTCVLQGFITEM
jgi:hypothetical protein